MEDSDLAWVSPATALKNVAAAPATKNQPQITQMAVKGEMNRVQLHQLTVALFGKPIELLAFNSCNVDDEGCHYVSELLKINSTIKSVRLEQNNFGLRGVKELALALKTPKCAVVSLNLADTSPGVGDEGAEALADLIKTSQLLESLDLYGNHMGSVGVKAIAEALKFNTSLTRLSLADNNINTEGALYLGEALKVNKVLKYLQVGDTNLDAVGIKHLALALKSNTTLIEIELWGNCIEGDGCKALADMLKGNKTLTALNIAECRVDAPGAIALADAIKVNQTLVYLDLYWNSFGAEGAQALAEAISHQHKSAAGLTLKRFGTDYTCELASSAGLAGIPGEVLDKGLKALHDFLLEKKPR